MFIVEYVTKEKSWVARIGPFQTEEQAAKFADDYCCEGMVVPLINMEDFISYTKVVEQLSSEPNQSKREVE